VSKKKPLKQQPKKVATPPKKERDYNLIFIWVAIAIVSLIRYRLITIPFERDEGEYSYIGSLFLHGIAPFKDAYSMKLPGTSSMYAVLMLIFGHSNSGVHLGMVFINAATMFLLYSAFKKIFNPFIGLVTSTVYGFMAVGLVFDGFAAHATHFICFYSAIGLLLFADYMKSGKIIKVFLFGLMLGMAFIMKQQAVFLILFGAAFLFFYLRNEKKETFPEIVKKLLLFGSGVIIPYVIVFFIIVITGQFQTFWLWTVKYASQYEAVKSLDFIVGYFKISFGPAWDDYNYFWVLGVAGLVVLYQSSYTRLQKLFALGYFIASACALSSGFYFRQHYFIVILPAIGLFTGIFIEFVVQRLKILKSPNVPLIILSGLVLITLYTSRKYFFSYAPKVVCAIAYWGNPFNEAPEVAKFIKDNTKDTDKIAVLGSEPEIYFYADRRAATGYLYTYPLVDKQPFNQIMQDQMINEIETTKPAYIVFCNIAYSWIVTAGSPRRIFEWGNSYTHTNYTPVGFADFFKDKGWQIFWGDEMKNHSNDAESFMIIFKRNPPVAAAQKI
jgi:hypothetical protein